tara:strand:- start:2124 stop:2612 length:489 start_codon:yes stop_codon:yes gene_type:complete
MNIEQKEFINNLSIPSIGENDIQGTPYRYDRFINFYIYNKDIVSKVIIQEYNTKYIDIIGNIPKKDMVFRRNNMIKRVEKGNDPISIGNYSLLDNNKIEMIWNYYNGENIELIFKGEILLIGDAIKGAFYKNGEINVPERVYYNVEKPLPNPLITECNEDIV